jgi:drug/metabolite transporter (DMT)-like permease
MRFVIAGAILCVALRASGGSLPPRRDWARHALSGVLLLGVGNGFVVWSELWIPTGLAAVNVASVPFWMAGTEAALGGERVSRRALIGLTVGFSGIVLLIWPSLFVSDVNGGRFALGVLFVQLACAGWALGSSLSRRTASAAYGIGAAALQQLFGGLLLLSLGTVFGEWGELGFSRASMAAQLYLIAFGSLIAYSAYLYALQHLPIATVSLYAYINPIIAVLLGSLFLNEPFTVRIAAAAALVLGGVMIVRSTARGGS